jgi:hypothetical protein
MWRPYEQCRESEERARRERDGAADDAAFEARDRCSPSVRAGELCERIAGARKQ